MWTRACFDCYPRANMLAQGESEHRRVKKWYSLCNKNKHKGQIAMKQQREKVLTDIKKHDRAAIDARERENTETAAAKDQTKPLWKRFQFGLSWSSAEDEELSNARFDAHHQMAESLHNWEEMFNIAGSNPDDPVLKVSIVSTCRTIYWPLWRTLSYTSRITCLPGS